jgi:hypothetical protein
LYCIPMAKRNRGDDSYEEGGEEPTNKKRQTAINTPQPPKPATKDLFSVADVKVIEKSLLELGNEYSKIKSQYFKDRNDVTYHDINNFVNRTPTLKRIQESNLKKSRNTCIENFRQANFQEKALNNINNNSNNHPTITDIDEDETKRIVKEPTQLSTGMWLLPSDQFLRAGPFFTKTPQGYHYCYRYHYAEPVSFRVRRDEKLLIFQFKSVQSLSEEEYGRLQFFKQSPGKPDEIKFPDSENQNSYISTYVVHTPEDADLHTFCRSNSSLDKKDHLYKYLETESGGLLELLIPKMQEINEEFSAPRNNVSISVRAKEVNLPGGNHNGENVRNDGDQNQDHMNDK